MREGPSTNGRKKADPQKEPAGLWHSIRSFVLGDDNGLSLREQLEEAIDEHETDEEEGEPSAEGDLSREEREMLRKVLHFSEHSADDVAIPRADVIAIAEDASFDECVALFSEHGHSRMPVFKDNLDHISGMIHIKDVFAILAEKRDAPPDLSELIRQPLFVPESRGVLDLLADMRASRTHLAIVLDEYSGTEGIVTIEDLVEEIVGEIEDEHDEEPEARLIELPGGLWDADARVELDDLGKQVDPALEEIEEDVDTLGGLAVVLAGKVPARGEMLEHPSGWRIEVLLADDKRIHRMRLHPPETAAAAP